MPTQKIPETIIDVIHACDSVQLATIRPDGYPETRHVANMMNHGVDDLTLFFMTGRNTPKAQQLLNNPRCCLYYYDTATHHSVRLFGTMELVTDKKSRHAHWDEEFANFGYDGPDDPEFILLRFHAAEYKYYDAAGIQTGKIK